MRRPVSGTLRLCPPLGSLPPSILRWEPHRTNKGKEVPTHPLTPTSSSFFGVLEIFSKGLHNIRDLILWQACGYPKEVTSARKTQKYRVALCLTIQQLTRMKLKFSEREEKHGNPNSFSGDAVVASAKGCPVCSRCGWVVRVLLF